MRQGPPELLRVEHKNKKPKVESALRKQGSIVEGLTPYENAQAFLDSCPADTREFARREHILHSCFWPELPRNFQIYVTVKKALEDLLVKSGLPQDFLDLVIFDSDNPDAHIQLYAKKVRISRSFLELVKGDLNKITSVIAHEVGHVILAHFKTKNTENPDPLDERVQGYEHEYQADRASVILTNRMGIPPTTLADTLGDIERKLRSGADKEEDKRSSGDFNPRSWILSTHPHTTRRIMAINRDSTYLPKYPSLKQDVPLSVPTSSEFPKIKIDRWKAREGFKATPFSYVDCLWEEIKPPQLLLNNAKLAGHYDDKEDEEKAKLISTPRDVLEFKKSKSPPIDATPDDVENWTAESIGDIDKWWDQSLTTVDSDAGYEDLSSEIDKYPKEVALLILKNSFPEYSALDKLFGTEIGEGGNIDAYKNFAIQFLLIPDEYYSNTELRIITSLLVRSLFKNDESLKTIQGFEAFCGFLRDFREEHGVDVSYSGARYFVRLEELFNQAQTDSEKRRVCEISKEYEGELVGGVEMGILLARSLMPNVCNLLDTIYPNLYTEKVYEAGKHSTMYQLPPEVKDALKNQDLSNEEARNLITKIPKNFRPKNLSMFLFSAMNEEAKKKERRGFSDVILESDPHDSASMLSSDDFEEKYFGSGREKYVKSPYISLDEHVPEYMDMLQLWNFSGYSEEFHSMKPGLDKVRFLLENFRVRSAMRDTLISMALGWADIVYVEDIVKTQEDILHTEEIVLLFELSDTFSNPLLSLTVSQRLWEIFERDSKVFLSSVPPLEQERISEELSNLPLEIRSERLRAILSCYKEPTYVRDELLRPLVDAAPNQETTLALASYYCEPPPGILHPRSGEVVAVTETILDALRGMSNLDKQELFLYFLGHRFFYSGIDSRFDRTLDKQKLDEDFRTDSIFMGEKAFLKKYSVREYISEDAGDTGGEDEDEEEIDIERLDTGRYSEDELRWLLRGTKHEKEDVDVDSKYLVKTPDSLIFLIKSSGVPVDLLLKQQRLTTTRREQRDFITQLLLGHEGVLLRGNREEFLNAVARNVVDNSPWSKEQSEAEKKAVRDLLGFALSNCPDRRLPDLFLGLWNLQQDKGSLPKVMTTLLRELGSLFIKAGQYMGTQSNALPKEWMQAFRELSDQNMLAEKTLVYEHIYALYGENSPFDTVGEKQGEGSMAAVYKGVLRKEHVVNGDSAVAVKIVHPNIRDWLAEDVVFLDKLVKFINSRKNEFKVRLPDNLSEVSRNQILRELSYESIVRNNNDMTEVLGRSKTKIQSKVPKILGKVSKPEAIVYQYSPGVPLDQLPEDVRPSVRGEVAIELLRQIFVEGIYQGDPNIGNFKAELPNDQHPQILVDWLDTDHVGRLTKPETKQLRSFVKNMTFDKNPKAISKSLASFIDISGANSIEGLRVDVEKWLVDNNILEESSVESLEKVFISFLDFLADKKLVLKEQYVTLLRALGLMKPMLEDVTKSQYMAFFAKIIFAG